MVAPARVSQLDLLRGVAVVMMVLGHTVDALLAEPLRGGSVYWSYQLLRSMTAPLFLFTSGFVVMVATAKRWDAYLRLGPELGARLRRILLLILLGYALHLPFFSLRKTLTHASPESFANLWQADVLQCIGVSLLLLQLTLLVARRPARHALLVAAAGALVVLVTPVVWSLDWGALLPRPVTPYVYDRDLTIFPLFPYLGHLFIGAAVGHSFVAAERAGRVAAWLRRLGLASVVAIVAGMIALSAPWRVFPEHDVWKANPASVAIRLALVALVLHGLFAWRRPPAALTAAATLLGRSSLFVYVLHLVLLYGSPLNQGLRSVVGATLPVGAVLGVFAALLVAMLGAAAGLERVERWRPPTWRRVQYGLAGAALALFVALPH